jgi:hypothetical protein
VGVFEFSFVEFVVWLFCVNGLFGEVEPGFVLGLISGDLKDLCLDIVTNLEALEILN